MTNIIHPIPQITRQINPVVFRCHRLTHLRPTRHNPAPHSGSHLIILEVISGLAGVASPRLRAGALNADLDHRCRLQLRLGGRGAAILPSLRDCVVVDTMQRVEALVRVRDGRAVPIDDHAPVVHARMLWCIRQHEAVQDRGAHAHGHSQEFLLVLRRRGAHAHQACRDGAVDVQILRVGGARGEAAAGGIPGAHCADHGVDGGKRIIWARAVGDVEQRAFVDDAVNGFIVVGSCGRGEIVCLLTFAETLPTSHTISVQLITSCLWIAVRHDGTRVEVKSMESIKVGFARVYVHEHHWRRGFFYSKKEAVKCCRETCEPFQSSLSHPDRRHSILIVVTPLHTDFNSNTQAIQSGNFTKGKQKHTVVSNRILGCGHFRPTL